MYESTILLTVSTDHVPFVSDDERVVVERAGAGVWRVIARYGFLEEADVPAILERVLPEIAPGQSASSVLYVLGRESVVAGPGGKMDRFTEPVFAWLSRNVRAATDYFAIPPEQVIEIGSQVDL
jgi:KUP system potassium uptake protein